MSFNGPTFSLCIWKPTGRRRGHSCGIVMNNMTKWGANKKKMPKALNHPFRFVTIQQVRERNQRQTAVQLICTAVDQSQRRYAGVRRQGRQGHHSAALGLGENKEHFSRKPGWASERGTPSHWSHLDYYDISELQRCWHCSAHLQPPTVSRDYTIACMRRCLRNLIAAHNTISNKMCCESINHKEHVIAQNLFLG